MTKQTSRIRQIACLSFALLIAGVSPANAQTRWDKGDSRDRNSSTNQRGSLWQGSNWLGGNTIQRPDWKLGVRGENSPSGVGVLVRDVTPRAAAARARIERGDTIVAVGGFQVGMVDGRLYDLSEEISRRANASGIVSLLIQDHRNYGLATVSVQLDSSQQSSQSLKGTLVYRDRSQIPTDAVVTVKIENVSRPYSQVRNGDTVFRASANGNMAFEIPYDPTYIDPQDTYQVRARVTSNGRTILDTPQPQRVLTGGNPSQVRMQLVSLSSTASGSGGGFVTAGYPNYNNVDDQLVRMYRRYLGRSPTSLELAALRATPGIAQRIGSMPSELMAAQEYFDAAGNHNRVWLEKVFGEIVRRAPSQPELEQWMRRYADLRFSRTELLKQLNSVIGK